MAKVAAARKKTVMQDIHPDVEARIEDLTDPEKIARARERIIDYAKVAESFATSTHLPDEDLDDQDGAFVAAPVTAPTLPDEIEDSSSSEDLDLLSMIEDGESSSEITRHPSTIVDEDDSDDIMFDENDGSLDALFAEMKDAGKSTAPSRTAGADEFDDLDTDLLSDDFEEDDIRNSTLGEDAFAPTSEDDGDDIFGIPAVQDRRENESDSGDDDIFGIPSVAQKPTPYGDAPADEDDEELARLLGTNDGRAVPAWMEDDYDDTEIPDISPVHPAGVDAQEKDVFMDADDTAPAKESRPIVSSSAALNDLMSLDTKDENVPEQSGDLNEDEGSVVVVPAPKAKKGLLGMFGRKKKTTTVEDLETGEVTETVTETQVSETVDGDTVVEVEETETVTPKKSKLLRNMAIMAVLLGGSALGAYALMETSATPTTTVSQPREFPVIDPVAEPVSPVIAPETPAEGSPVESETPFTISPEMDVPADPVDLGVIEPTDSPIEAPIVIVVETDDPVSSDLDPLVLDGDGTPLVTGDADPADMFEQLYGSGVSETDISQEQAQTALAEVSAMQTLIDEQRAALEAALVRVQTLESVMADRDASIAAVQEEAVQARQIAQEAREIALSQNNVLIEVVGIRDKMQIAEELIVDLSQRTALIESDDAQAGEIRQLNERIAEMSRDMGLLARTVLTNGQNLANQRAAQAAADQAHQSAQNAVDAQTEATLDRQTTPAPAGSGEVYDNERRLMTPPVPGEIPDDVKVGDVLDGFGEVLDITPMEDGSRLVIMDNDSKILPRR